MHAIRSVLAPALAACLLAPSIAHAGGTAGLAPTALDEVACRPDSPAPFEGVPATVPPTTLGCVSLADGSRALVAAYRWSLPQGDQTCFFVVPAGGREVDGPCTHNAHHEGGADNALGGASGVFPSVIRRVGDRLIIRGQASPDITSVDLVFEGGGEVLPAELLPVEGPLARELGSRASFGYFAAEISVSELCDGIVAIGYTAEGRFHERPVADPSQPGLGRPGAPGCLLRRMLERLRTVVRRMVSGADPPDLPPVLLGPRANVVGSRISVAGRSLRGEGIRLKQYGRPSLEREVLVFGCVHGDECEARDLKPLVGGCPPPNADVYVVPNLNPDGFALGTRLNGRGVDLNRNFPSEWKPIGRRWGPQYSGPRPFSERETRVAARIIRAVRPEVTIWFHQHHDPRPLVRAWGGSVDAARRYAELASLPFRRLPWLAGTAPNWQNHAFPGTASFVVEMPRGPIPARVRHRLGSAVAQLGREVGED